MPLEVRVEAISEPVPLVDMLEGIYSRNGETRFEFVAYVPGSEYDFTSIVATETFDMNRVRQIGLENLARELLGRVYVEHDEIESMLGRIAVGLTSRIRGGHLPQIDFSCSKDREDEVYELTKSFGIDGYVLCSGRSYHFQGSEGIDENVWKSFVKGLSDYHDIVDMDWAEECGENGYSVLRITDARPRQQIPMVVARVRKLPKYEGQLELPF